MSGENSHRPSSGSISSDEDLEGGEFQFNTFHLNEEDEANIDCAREELIVPKCVSFNGRRSRRLSSDRLTRRSFSRRESELSEKSKNSSTEASSSYETPVVYRTRTRSSINSVNSDPKQTNRSCNLLWLVFLAIFALSTTYAAHLWRVQHLHEKVEELHEARRSVEESHDKLSDELKVATHNMAQYDNMKRLKEQHSANLLTRAMEAEGKLQNLMDKIRRESAQQVLETYGPNPRLVELDIEFPSGDVKTVKLELASIDTTDGMPHAVNLFLQQIQSKAWEGATFTSKGHTLLFNPQDDNTKPTHVASRHISSILFPEYSSSNPHSEYTVAFSEEGLYINVKTNNSPKVQDKFIEGESCFAKIEKESRDVIDAMKSGGAILKDARIVLA